MTQKKPIVALIYDYDGTLSPGNMQEFGFIQAVGKTAEEFWRMSDSIAIGQDASNVLAYMKLMFDEARKNGIKLRREDFLRFGRDIQLFEGVREWFRLINRYGEEHGVRIEHYINSSSTVGLTIASTCLSTASRLTKRRPSFIFTRARKARRYKGKLCFNFNRRLFFIVRKIR